MLPRVTIFATGGRELLADPRTGEAVQERWVPDAASDRSHLPRRLEGGLVPHDQRLQGIGRDARTFRPNACASPYVKAAVPRARLRLFSFRQCTRLCRNCPGLSELKDTDWTRAASAILCLPAPSPPGLISTQLSGNKERPCLKRRPETGAAPSLLPHISREVRYHYSLCSHLV